MKRTDESDPVYRLQETKSVDRGSFDAAVAEEAEVIKDHIHRGTFDNAQTAVGFEYEFYAVDRDGYALRRVPRDLLGSMGFEKELGLHNTELTCTPQPLNDAGLTALQTEVRAKVEGFQSRAAGEQIRIVSDGMWTIGPAQTDTSEYLTSATHEEGLTLAINVANAVRYHGFGSVDDDPMIGGHIDVDTVTIDADNAGPVSLTSSIQPHYQPEHAATLPSHMRSALRVAGPLVALGANSPLFPPELYDGGVPAGADADKGHHELRIPVYEQMMNPQSGDPKVCFPRDIETSKEAVDRIADDTTIVPAEIDAGERFDDQFVHFKHKHGSYWRWVRPVFDGASEDSANARIEFRPLPGQPTIPDSVAFVALVAGLLRGMHETDHPARELDWDVAKSNFYAAARDGFDADLIWRTRDGTRTTDTDELYTDLFETAVDGLERHGLDRTEAVEWVGPLQERVRKRQTPATWKMAAVDAAYADGLTPAEALRSAQRKYIDRQAATMYTGHLTDWPAP